MSTRPRLRSRATAIWAEGARSFIARVHLRSDIVAGGDRFSRVGQTCDGTAPRRSRQSADPRDQPDAEEPEESQGEDEKVVALRQQEQADAEPDDGGREHAHRDVIHKVMWWATLDSNQ